MKHLIFVSVALGIFSGTSLQGKAQTAVNSVVSGEGKSVKKSPQFIEDIEIRPLTGVSTKTPVVISANLISVSQPAPSRNSGSDIETFTSIQFKYAQLLDMEVESVTNSALYAFIEKWWSTPYQYGGATKDGIDCSAYVGTLVHDVYGLVLSRTARSQYAECEKVKKNHLREGDLVFFKTRRSVSHVGVYLGNGYFTHASTSNGVIISRLDDAYYAKKYIGGGRIAAAGKVSE